MKSAWKFSLRVSERKYNQDILWKSLAALAQKIICFCPQLFDLIPNAGLHSAMSVYWILTPPQIRRWTLKLEGEKPRSMPLKCLQPRQLNTCSILWLRFLREARCGDTWNRYLRVGREKRSGKASWRRWCLSWVMRRVRLDSFGVGKACESWTCRHTEASGISELQVGLSVPGSEDLRQRLGGRLENS